MPGAARQAAPTWYTKTKVTVNSGQKNPQMVAANDAPSTTNPVTPDSMSGSAEVTPVEPVRSSARHGSCGV